MRWRSSAVFVLVVAAGLTVSAAAPALAAETAASEFVIIQADDLVGDDLYAGGVKVSVEGRVEGDLVAVAAEEIVISGTVTGSVFAVAPRVTVTGTIGRSLRAAARILIVDGQVGGDVVQMTFDTAFGPDSEISGEVVAWAASMSALGRVGVDIFGSVGSFELAGFVGRDVDVSVSRLSITGPLEVGGDLGYRSKREATGLAKAEVGGTIVKKTPLPQNIRIRALGFLWRFLLAIFLTVAAISVAHSWPARTTEAVRKVGSKMWKSWVYGAGIIALPLLVAVLGAVLIGLAPPSAALPLLFVMIPLVLAISGVVLLVSLVAGVPAVAWLGSKLFSRLDVPGSVVAGSTVVAVLWFLPLVGWLVPLLVLPVGLGAWLRSRPSAMA